MNTHTLAHASLHSHTCTRILSHACTHILTLTDTHTRILSHTCTCILTLAHACPHIPSHTCTHILTRTHLHTHPCTYTLAHTSPRTLSHTSLHSHTLAHTSSRAHPYTHTLAFVCSLPQLAHLLEHPHARTHSHTCIVSPVHTPFLSLTHSFDKHSHSIHLQSAVPWDTPLLQGSALTPDLPQKSWEDHIPLLGDLVTAAVSPLFMGLWDEFLTCLLSQGELRKDSLAAAPSTPHFMPSAQHSVGTWCLTNI